ncbi:hypothetical protein [Ancylobacter sp. IITR112]|uniref:hypothetical protein n=1 Tax=Ancylobacter sp. IITR112 TaxID=3138073 RepID=UPI00352B77F0
MMSTADNKQSSEPHCVHVIGIGRTGAVYVEALFRTGEAEDNLTREGTALASLVIDIGDDDIEIANDYARSFGARLTSRGIAADKYHHEALVLDAPDKATFEKKIEAVLPLFTDAGGEGLLSPLPKAFEPPKAGEHTPRAVAKAIAAFGLYLDDKPVAGALQRFADQVKRCTHSSTVLIAFGLAGGTGSGMAFDIARELAKLGLGDAVQLVGLGQLSHSGDGAYQNNLAQTMAIEDIDRAAFGSADKNVFPGGCFIVSTEHSWQRLTAYTTTGLREVRQHFKQLVTNRFVADSFMRWAVSDKADHLTRVLEKAGGKTIMFNVAKFSHPGVQVLPGQPRSIWDAVLHQWISFVPNYAGLSDSYKTDYVEAHVYTSRDMQHDVMIDELGDLLKTIYLGENRENYHSFSSEFFDELTSYANIILPSVKKDDLTAYGNAVASGTADAKAKALEQA